MKYTIIKDSREKLGWEFAPCNFCKEMRVEGLYTGDYTVEGFEKVLCIERKRTTGEIAINLGSKIDTFTRELERMREIEFKYLIFEFDIKTLQSFPALSGIPKEALKGIRMNAGFMIKSLEKLESEYGFETIYCSSKDQANEIAYQIMKDIYVRFS
jgi:hypothetical protein